MIGKNLRPDARGFSALRIRRRINMNISIETIPDNTGETNQETTYFKKIQKLVNDYLK